MTPLESWGLEPIFHMGGSSVGSTLMRLVEFESRRIGSSWLQTRMTKVRTPQLSFLFFFILLFQLFLYEIGLWISFLFKLMPFKKKSYKPNGGRMKIVKLDLRKCSLSKNLARNRWVETVMMMNDIGITILLFIQLSKGPNPNPRIWIWYRFVPN